MEHTYLIHNVKLLTFNIYHAYSSSNIVLYFHNFKSIINMTWNDINETRHISDWTIASTVDNENEVLE